MICIYNLELVTPAILLIKVNGELVDLFCYHMGFHNCSYRLIPTRS